MVMAGSRFTKRQQHEKIFEVIAKPGYQYQRDSNFKAIGFVIRTASGYKIDKQPHVKQDKKVIPVDRCDRGRYGKHHVPVIPRVAAIAQIVVMGSMPICKQITLQLITGRQYFQGDNAEMRVRRF